MQLANDRLNIKAFDRSFYDQLDEKLKRTEYRSLMSASEAAMVFDELWKQYENDHKKRSQETRKKNVDVQLDVVTTFREVLRRHRHNELLHAVVFDFNSSELSSKLTEIGTGSDETWFEKYFKINYSLVQRAHRFVFSTPDRGLAKGLVAVQELKKKVHNLQERLVKKIESENGKCDTAIVTDIVSLATDEVLIMETALEAPDASIKLQRAPFINDLIVHLQQVAYRAVCSAEEKRMSEEKRELEMKRVRKRQAFLTIVSNKAGGLERAATFAEEYSEQLNLWVNTLVDDFALEVRRQVYEEMPNPENATNRAYHSSFTVGNYEEVLEYCIDVNAYLKKLFMQMFENRKQIAIEKEMDTLKDRVSEMYNVIINVAERWRQSFQPSGRLADFKAYLAKCAENKSESASVRSLLMIALDRFPQITNFTISKVEIFCEKFKCSMGKLLTEVRSNYLQETLESSMIDERERIWKEIKGCQAKCPLCGSKCSLVFEHKDHYCTHHIFPAFRGVRVRNLNYPVFDMCLSTDTARKRRGRGDDPFLPSLAAFLDHYDDCRSWKKSLVPDPTLIPLPVQQIAAWVNCRKPLLKYWNLVDKTPEEWLIYQSKKPLEEDECDKAKARLEKYRDV